MRRSLPFTLLEAFPSTRVTHCPSLRFQSTTTYHESEHTPPPSRRPRRRRVMSTDAADSDGEIQNRGQQSALASKRANGENPRRSRFDGFFPLSYKQGFSQWWSNIPAAEAEHRVLSLIPYLQKPPTHTQTGSEPPSKNPSTLSVVDTSPSKQAPPITTNSITDPYGPRTWYSRMVQLSGKNRALNEFSVERTGEEADQNLVIIHGYGAGLGFFYKNFEPLSRAKGWHLYALDMLGMGRSSRPPFRIKSKKREDQIKEAEDWFIDSLEEWRVKKGIDKFTLCGHSMGGYMAVCYALKYPGRLNKLILASPVGIPEDPYATHAAMPDQKEVDQAQQDEATASKTNTPPPRRPYNKIFTYLWEANVSVFDLVRWSGPLGPRLVSGWTSRRFSHLPADEGLALHDYSYSLFRQRGSGEYALAYILAPGAFARSPLIRRVQGIGRQPLPADLSTSSSAEPQLERGLPVVFMYGENDWMDVKGGYAAKKKIDAERARALRGKSEAEIAEDQGGAKVVIVKKAGHHVYLDSADEFNDVMLAEMEDVRKRTAGQKKGGMGGIQFIDKKD
ncbi:alpha/beta hydrolase [Exophiala viscosa]|uniref:alpha/beta hydrolase n=1 Tax=Exophiala viscosa TaxID=2486360 RepID=UPI00219EECA4|nr:alpha/beta hydrolase [Exophiala viscosa]